MGSAEALRRLALARDSDAWSAILENHGASILRMAQRVTGDGALCDDVCQEALLQIRAHAGKFKPPAGTYNADSAAKGWIMCIAYRTALGMLRLRARRSENEMQAGFEHLSLTPPERDPALATEELALLRQEINSLPELLRGAVCLHFFGQMSYPELSAALECSENTARKRVERAVKRLRERLAFGGVSLSAGTLLVTLSGSTHTANAAASATPFSLNPCHAKWLALLNHPAAPALPGIATTIGGLTLMTKTILVTAAALAFTAASIQTLRVNSLTRDLNEAHAKAALVDGLSEKFSHLEKQFAENRGETAALKACLTTHTDGIARIEGKLNALEQKSSGVATRETFNVPLTQDLALGAAHAALLKQLEATIRQVPGGQPNATEEAKDFTFKIIGATGATELKDGEKVTELAPAQKDKVYYFKQGAAGGTVGVVLGTGETHVEIKTDDAKPVKPPRPPQEAKKNGTDEKF